MYVSYIYTYIPTYDKMNTQIHRGCIHTNKCNKQSSSIGFSQSTRGNRFLFKQLQSKYVWLICSNEKRFYDFHCIAKSIAYHPMYTTKSCVRNVRTHMYIHTYVFITLQTIQQIHKYTNSHTHTLTCVPAYIYVCTYVHIHMCADDTCIHLQYAGIYLDPQHTYSLFFCYVCMY